ncbi:MAG: triphosphoribosyl-dephospho-CoA synthase [Clostridia bacterium]|nr:triphosphoribosyl-dephospho-CoA synthase [Clostridia bacterium]
MTELRIARLAAAALVEEVYTTPKPGLVDLNNNGAHRDMTVQTFLYSAAALQPYFRQMAELGRTLPQEDLLPALRESGIRAEAAMFAATGGVNTHKGALISLGLLCGAAGQYLARGIAPDAEALCACVAHMTRGICARELGVGEETHGQGVYRKYGTRGIRGEAESGFASVRAYSLPRFRKELAQGTDYGEAAVKALLALIAHVPDTTVLHRRDEATAAWAAEEAARCLAAYDEQAVLALDEAFIRENVSHGGCADLLAVTIFLHRLETEWASLEM